MLNVTIFRIMTNVAIKFLIMNSPKLTWICVLVELFVGLIQNYVKDHAVFVKKIEDKVNISIKANVVKQLIKKNLAYP